MFLKVGVPLLAVFMTVIGAGLLGGPIDADVNSEDVQDALTFAVTEHNKQSNDLYRSQVMKVIKAQKQLVSGVNYIFTVEMATTNCKKDDLEKVCDVHPDPDVANARVCELKVWNQPWTKTVRIVKNTCL